MKTPEIMNRKDAAKTLRCSERKVDRLIVAGVLVASKCGRSVLIDTESVTRLLPRR